MGISIIFYSISVSLLPVVLSANKDKCYTQLGGKIPISYLIAVIL